MNDEMNEDLSMSDEDFLSMQAPSYEPAVAELDNSDEDTSAVEDDTTTPDSDEEQGDDDTTDTVEGDDSTDVNEDDVSSEDSQEEEADADDLTGDLDELDFEALHNQLLQPFNANGSEMQVNNVEEAVKLMQMGANYSKKMTALKPNMKLLKMLENNDLLDEAKLNLLIDVAAGNTDAISQLVRDNNIDPLNLKTEEENKYTPKNHTVGDHQVDLDDVISRIQDTTSFTDTMDIVSSKWDETSKRDIANNPNALEVINTHVSNGTYATIQSEVERIKVFGGLQGVSDFDAYKQVGDQLFTAGKITMDGKPKATEKVVVKTAPKAQPSNKTRTDKRKAASPTKNSSTPKAKQPDYNPLALSDEDFENLKF